MKELLLRTLTGVSLIVLVTGSILLGPLSFLAIVLVVYLLGVRELFGLLQKRDLAIRWIRAIPGALLIIIAYAVFQYGLSMLWFLLPPALWLITALRGGITLSGTLAFLWLAIPLSSFLVLGWVKNEPGFHYRMPLALIALVWINDTFAYLSGSLLGKHKMTPVLSPGKTWEGFFGGGICTILSAYVISGYNFHFDMPTWLIIGVVVWIFGVVGDFSESAWKRYYSIKDSGTVMQGHGGFLDRLDSFVYSVPIISLIAYMILKT